MSSQTCCFKDNLWFGIVPTEETPGDTICKNPLKIRIEIK
jgi:hypothetical protein